MAMKRLVTSCMQIRMLLGCISVDDTLHYHVTDYIIF